MAKTWKRRERILAKTWKRRERDVAKDLGTERTPLSGSNSKHTGSDTLSETYYVEHKHRKRQAIYTLWRKVVAQAKKENKTPLVTLSEHNQPGYLVVMHSSTFKQFLKWSKDHERSGTG